MTTLPQSTMPTPQPTQYDCNFDNNQSPMCLWQQDKTDQFDWTRAQGPTGTTYTGPTTDHTTGTRNGWYIYIEASGSRRANDKARIVSPSISDTQPRCLSFWYNMYGTHINTLNVYVQGSGNLRAVLSNPVWTRKGTQGNQWKQAKVPIKPTGSYQVIFEALRGISYRGDIALDDINMAPGNCNSGSTTQTCTFENDQCGYTNNNTDQFHWKRQARGTPSRGTGPSVDHTLATLQGHYMYMESSTPMQPNQRSHLITKPFTASTNSPMCLTFYYHMYGRNVGTLNVYKINNGQLHVGLPIWNRNFNQGDKWRPGQVTLNPTQDFQIVFEGVRGNGYLGDIAIDDVSMKTGSCNAPGFCDFEKNTCNYQNVQSDDFDWLRHRGRSTSASTGPSTDHTKGNSLGYYMYIETSSPRVAGNKARLFSEVFPPKQTGSCFVFWYHMYGADVDSLNIYVLLNQTDTVSTEALLWQQKGDGGNVWQNGQMNIPTKYTKNPYQIIIEGIRGKSYHGDVAIDDVALNDGTCTTLPSGANVSQYGAGSPFCDFDTDLCTWTQSDTDQFNWTRSSGGTPSAGTGPIGDHSGTGYYLYLEASGRRQGSTAVLNSQVQAPTQPAGNCFVFWYHMYGPQVGKLSVYTQSQGRNIQRWTKIGTQGNKWQQASFTFTSTTDYQIMIQGTVGTGFAGDMAIDDVNMDNVPCVNSSLINQGQSTTCTFENGFCGWTQDKTDDFDWLRHANTTGTVGTGPYADHTTGSGAGYYIYTEASNPRRPNDKARLLSPVFPQTSGECLKFYYNMNGRTMGTFNIYTADLSGNLGSVVWSRSGNQGNKWSFGQVTLKTTGSFQVVFESVRGSSYQSDIAVDDVSITSGACPLPGSCDFETGFCGFSNTQQGDQFDWDMGSGGTPSFYTGPKSDHTTNSAQGHYVFIESSKPRTGDKAWLVSEQLPATTGACLTFWYSMYGSGIGTLNVWYTDSTSNKTLFTVSRNKGTVWLKGQSDITTSRPYNLVFEAVRGTSYRGDIALDDISVVSGICSLQTTTGPTQPTVAPTQTSLQSCTFENGFCGYVQDKSDTLDWTRKNGGTTSVGTGPRFDHTLNNFRGYYIYIEASRNSNKTARINTPAITSSGTVCVSFWYHMYGVHINMLTMYILKGGSRKVMWEKSGNQGNKWINGRVDATVDSGNSVIFEGKTGSSYQGDIALDDIYILNGPCTTNQALCDFESSSICGYQQAVDDNFDWMRGNSGTSSRGTGPPSDHTYGTSQGHYMFIESSAPRKQYDKARLATPQYPATNQQCLTFWYHMYGSDIGTLNVYISTYNRLNSPILTLQGNKGNKWKIAQTTIQSQVKFKVVFEGIRGGGYQGDIAIDDVTIKSGSCAGVGTCNFEKDTCGWVQRQDDRFDWLRRNGRTPSAGTGPGSDHTLGSGTGFYMFIESSRPRKTGDNAVLQSQNIPNSDSYCFKYWYNMNGANIGMLNVSYMYGDGTKTALNSISGNQGPTWKQSIVPIKGAYQDFTILVEGIVGSGFQGDIAVDDFVLDPFDCSTETSTNGTYNCQDGKGTTINLNKVCDFKSDCPNSQDESNCGSCDFETDFCAWTTLGTGSFTWSRGGNQTVTANTGPAFDHTLGNARGHYIYVDANQGSFTSQAEIDGPLLQPCSSTCQINFWYHMYGSGIGTLRVLIQEGNKYTEIWRKSRNQGNKWIQATVDIGRVAKPFSLAFRATRTFNVRGDISLDDIQLMNCNFPAVQQTCLSSQFRCTRGACVSKNSLCDFTDDCGDNSDEGNCANFPGRCDFETSICNWSQDKSDTFDWIRATDHTASGGTGPSRDHTRGTANGYYMYIEASRPRVKGDKARLVSPTMTKNTNKQNSVCTVSLIVSFLYLLYI